MAMIHSGQMDKAFINTGGTGEVDKAEQAKRRMFLFDPSKMNDARR
jgi:hypothetical protein